MPGPPPAVAACRRVVRTALAGLPAEGPVLVACSGGADSLALAAAAAFEGPRAGRRVGAVVVDHRLQTGSDRVAEQAARQCRDLGLDPVQVMTVQVGVDGGPEAAARTARYAALERACSHHGAAAVLLGHTADDQAEQVLLGLARGSGTRTLAGIAPRGTLPTPPTGGLDPEPAATSYAAQVRSETVALRPFVEEIAREQTRAACAAQGLSWWDDPHNDDPRFLRVRVREVLADLEERLGPGLRSGLVRTAQIARVDADLLDELAEQAADDLGEPPWDAAELARLPEAVRTRVWRVLMVHSGAVGADVGRVHVMTLDALVTDWHGQGPIDVPGGLRVRRTASRLDVEPRQVE